MIPPPVLCLSHLDWTRRDGRPYQVMTRLARERRVYVLEHTARTSRLPLLSAARSDEVTVLTPLLPATVAGDEAHRLLAPLVASLLDREGVDLPTVWVCDAQRLPVVSGVATSAVVYDCPAGSETHSRAAEAEVLERADVVLAATPDDARRLTRRHRRVHLVPDGARRAGAGSWAATAAMARRLVDLRVAESAAARSALQPFRPTVHLTAGWGRYLPMPDAR